jgi:hypothetical protein
LVFPDDIHIHFGFLLVESTQTSFIIIPTLDLGFFPFARLRYRCFISSNQSFPLFFCFLTSVQWEGGMVVFDFGQPIMLERVRVIVTDAGLCWLMCS